MLGKTHKKFGAIFSAGVTYIYLTKHPELLGNHEYVNILATLPSAAAGALGYISATWADADIYTSGMQEITPKTRPDMVIWALIFQVMGLKDHREFQSHSPVLWVPIWGILFKTAMAFNFYIGLVIYAFAMGYCSHIIADGFTTDGIKLFPNFKESKMVKRLKKTNKPLARFLIKLSNVKFRPMGLKANKHGVFKASYKWWNTLFLILSMDVFLAFISFDSFIAINSVIVQFIFSFFTSFLGAFLISLKDILDNIIVPFLSDFIKNLRGAS